MVESRQILSESQDSEAILDMLLASEGKGVILSLVLKDGTEISGTMTDMQQGGKISFKEGQGGVSTFTLADIKSAKPFRPF